MSHRGQVQDGALTSTATKTGRFLPRSASWIEEMEKRSHRRIRDLDVLAAFQGLVANEIGCARISMMTREQNTPLNGPNTDARDQLSPDRHIKLAPHGRSDRMRADIHDGQRAKHSRQWAEYRCARPMIRRCRIQLAPHGRSIQKYIVKRRGPPSQRWRTFLRNHPPHIAAMDLFVVPTIGFNLLYAFVVVRLARRDLVWINVTAYPTAEWIAQQITEAFPWNEAPRYLIRDRDGIYDTIVRRRLRAMGIRDKPISAGSPWQNCFAERLIGSIRRECVNHVVAFGEQHLRRVLRCYVGYYNEARTHRSLNKDAPIPRPVHRFGRIASHALVGGLHHQYVRI